MSRFRIIQCNQWLSGITEQGPAPEVESFIYFKIVETIRGRPAPSISLYRRRIADDDRKRPWNLSTDLKNESLSPIKQARYEPIPTALDPAWTMTNLSYATTWANLPMNLRKTHLEIAHPNLKNVTYALENGMSIPNGRTAWLERQKKDRPDPKNLKITIIEQLAKRLPQWKTIEFGWRAPNPPPYSNSPPPWDDYDNTLTHRFAAKLDYLKSTLVINGGFTGYAYGCIDNRYIFTVGFFSSPRGCASSSSLRQIVDVAEEKIIFDSELARRAELQTQA